MLTGYPNLDRALGDGYPSGRITEIAGTGARALAFKCLAQVQAPDVTAYVDAIQSLDLLEARKAGVDCTKMLLSTPGGPTQTWEVLVALVRSGQVRVVVYEGPDIGTAKDWRRLCALAVQTQTTVLVLSPALETSVHAFFASVRVNSDGRHAFVHKNKLAPVWPLPVPLEETHVP